jgi:hypothetical protein
VKHHILKCESTFWGDVADGHKAFEVRKDDRGYRVGDTLCLKNWRSDRQGYSHEFTGLQEKVVMAHVGYLLYGGQFGIEPDFVVLGLTNVRVALNHGPGTNDGSEQ